MLNYLKINDFALIERAEAEFSSGFTVITGESGAGKSILMNSIALLTGERVERGGIRSGCKSYTVSGEFTVPPALLAGISSQLEEAGINFSAEEPQLTLRRVVSASATRNFINDIQVSSRLLSDIGCRLIDLHGANEQISLTVPARQLELLDNFADLAELRKMCADTVAEIRALNAEKSAFESNLPDAGEADRCALIVEEISAVNPAPDEDEELSAKQRIGSNARLVLETISMLTGMLTENEDGIADQLGTVYHHLSGLEKIDASLVTDAVSVCAELQNSVSELSSSLAALTEKIDLDPESLAATEARLSELHTLKRRYGPTLEQVFAARDAATEKLQKYKDAQKRRSEFAEEEKALAEKLDSAAAKLSAARKAAAVTFIELARKKLVAIGFEHASFDVEFSTVPPGANGSDRIELLFNANAGGELRPLRKVASSGELSRVMLALKTVLADADDVPTVIFDEIDMNIGGETANKVAEELHELGKKRQIFCISHLAQVAARGDHHFLVYKKERDGRTISTVCELDDPAPELARMLGGGESALKHAKELCRQHKK
ncbi:MAG: DNA repair protein RecN [Lentisphaerae bacterium]|nr:DNA repair protein RecN [Lentisphaerota bacterium]